MSEYVSPVYNVKAIPVEKIRANNYNPNKVAPPEMKLLEISIWEDGFTQPIVCYHDKANDEYIVVARLSPLYDDADQRANPASQKKE